ncbi:Glycosyltransferase, GT2 family [Pseudomonas syringae]|uniref:glycosyltransferase family 2 protein n=1 Tax=Pseudomonas syringae TaxID=317 RepID=UPI0008971DEE|nr:glycosyltransferase family 2 protein [Pseudomonas syringae]SDX27180.1 Glycosyltransferase, GT2 family [Pseudomonas syringae]SFM69435.1 Glycosyltransferase, GT2 family [Pseudomonas syringae]
MSEHILNTPATGHPLNDTRYSGAITGLYGDVLQGWALDTAQADERLVVEIYIDGACVALVRADQFHPGAEAGDQFNGFGVQLRQSWLDDAKHIGARVANSEAWLKGDLHLPTTPSQEPAPIASQVWHSGGLRIGGWSWDPDAPQRHVHITVREGSQVLGQVICDTHHQALVYRATSHHGFSFDLPWELADGKLHVLDIENDLGHPLSGSPITLCCWHDGLEGLLKEHERAPTEQNLALLTQLARDQSMRLPKSAGFHHYPEWFERFRPAAPTTDQLLQIKIGLLLISEGDNALEAISLASLEDQRVAPHRLATASADDLMPALKQLLQAGCEAVIPIMAGDHLSPHALEHFDSLLRDGSDWGYADCDRDGPQGERSLPWMKPVWDIDLFIGADIFTCGAMFGAAIIDKALMLLPAAGQQQTLDWHHLLAAIALATETTHAVVTHLPHVLYHRSHCAPASPEQAEPSAQRLQAMAWLCENLTPGTSVTPLPRFPALFRAQWPLPASLPRVSLIIPTRDQFALLQACIEGLLTATDYPDMEIIVVDNQSSDPQTLTYLEQLSGRGVRVVPYPHAFNYSAINNYAISHATGELIGLINNDIEIIDAGWLKEMVSQLLRPGVGAVGAKLLWPNRMVQHGGVVVGVNGLAAHTGNNLEQQDAGYLGMNQITRRQSAVTAACLLLRKSVFDELEGLDEQAFPVAFNDVDLCLRIREKGLSLIWTPFAELIHAESASRGKDQTPEKRARGQREQQGFIDRWSQSGQSDPYYHPALSLDYLSGPYGGLAMPPRETKARKNHRVKVST